MSPSVPTGPNAQIYSEYHCLCPSISSPFPLFLPREKPTGGVVAQDRSPAGTRSICNKDRALSFSIHLAKGQQRQSEEGQTHTNHLLPPFAQAASLTLLPLPSCFLRGSSLPDYTAWGKGKGREDCRSIMGEPNSLPHN